MTGDGRSMLAAMRGLRIAFALFGALVGLAAPAGARADDDDIEMEPEQAPPPPDPDAPAEPAADAPAEPPPVVKDPKLAKKLLAAGQQALRKGDALARAKKPDDAIAQYEAALAALQKAIEVGDDVLAYFELATVEEKLGKYDLALAHYRFVVAAPPRSVRADVLKKATAKVDEVALKVGVVTLVVKPDGATVTLGGKELGVTPLPPLTLMPGTYTIAVSAEGFQPKESEIVVEEGSESERSIELEEVKIIVEQARPAIDDPIEAAPVAKAPSKVPLFVGAGATLAAIGIATITGVIAMGEHDIYVAPGSRANERADAKAHGERMALVTDLALVGAVAGAAFTVSWYLLKYRPAQRKLATETKLARGAKVDLVPWVQSSAAGPVGLGVVGSF